MGRSRDSAPSDKAVEAADNAQLLGKNPLEAAHDPALGLDRSVCLRDVMRALRGYGYPGKTGTKVADFIERELGRGGPGA